MLQVFLNRLIPLEAVGKIPIMLRERALKSLTSTESLKSNKE